VVLVRHLLIAHPASLTMVVAVMTSRPSIWVRSVCETTLRASRLRPIPFLLLEPSFRISSGRRVPGLRSDSAGDTARGRLIPRLFE